MLTVLPEQQRRCQDDNSYNEQFRNAESTFNTPEEGDVKITENEENKKTNHGFSQGSSTSRVRGGGGFDEGFS